MNLASLWEKKAGAIVRGRMIKWLNCSLGWRKERNVELGAKFEKVCVHCEQHYQNGSKYGRTLAIMDNQMYHLKTIFLLLCKKCIILACLDNSLRRLLAMPVEKLVRNQRWHHFNVSLRNDIVFLFAVSVACGNFRKQTSKKKTINLILLCTFAFLF